MIDLRLTWRELFYLIDCRIVVVLKRKKYWHSISEAPERAIWKLTWPLSRYITNAYGFYKADETQV
jgi:hypothetical protein